jgi:hypothetical protein
VTIKSGLRFLRLEVHVRFGDRKSSDRNLLSHPL